MSTPFFKATLVTSLLAIPVFYMLILQLKSEEFKTPSYGKVSNFSYVSDRDVFTPADLGRRVSVVANLKNCGPCIEELKELEAFKSWVDLTLKNPNKLDSKPEETAIVILSSSQVKAEFADKIFVLKNNETFLSPLESVGSHWVAISQEGIFAGVRKSSDDDPSFRKLMQRLTSDTHLLHYLYEQALFWKEAKAKYRYR